LIMTDLDELYLRNMMVPALVDIYQHPDRLEDVFSLHQVHLRQELTYKQNAEGIR
jgi:hypothetical protein